MKTRYAFTFSSFLCLPCPTVHFNCSRALGPKCTLALPTLPSFTVTPAVDIVTTTFCFAIFPPVKVYGQRDAPGSAHATRSGQLDSTVLRRLHIGHFEFKTDARELTTNLIRSFGNCLLATRSSTSQSSTVPSGNLTRISSPLPDFAGPSTITPRSQPSSVSTEGQNDLVTNGK